MFGTSPNQDQFLTNAESADVDKALLSNPEKFLTRLTISSLRLLKIIDEDRGVKIEELSHQLSLLISNPSERDRLGKNAVEIRNRLNVKRFMLSLIL